MYVNLKPKTFSSNASIVSSSDWQSSSAAEFLLNNISTKHNIPSQYSFEFQTEYLPYGIYGGRIFREMKSTYAHY